MALCGLSAKALCEGSRCVDCLCLVAKSAVGLNIRAALEKIRRKCIGQWCGGQRVSVQNGKEATSRHGETRTVKSHDCPPVRRIVEWMRMQSPHTSVLRCRPTYIVVAASCAIIECQPISIFDEADSLDSFISSATTKRKCRLGL
ncbi:hypothetical protein OUZ56_024931 [Daphnia magna]|uniref:Uncharacterized protein n=1 Tax=Daphnia magna TaxID=35525 RepID=A0ABQ9ZIE5_9CRUS|nr:hypothetical protein OUZ56_024931 [Daphnia magna]